MSRSRPLPALVVALVVALTVATGCSEGARSPVEADLRPADAVTSSDVPSDGPATCPTSWRPRSPARRTVPRSPARRRRW